MEITCAHCGEMADLPAGWVNRSRALGLNLYCSRRCSGLARRKHKTKRQRVEEKRLYDIEYRRLNREVLKTKKRARHLRTYDPEKQRAYNKRRMPHHVEYCRRPEYRRYKSDYDRRRRDAEYGPFAEAARLAIDLNREIKGRITNHEIKWQNQTSNKTQRRSREAKEENRSRPRHRARRRAHSTTLSQ